MHTAQTTIHSDSFNENLLETLVTTLIQGLRGGESFDFVSSQPPENFISEIAKRYSGAVLVEHVKKDGRQWRVRLLRTGADRSKDSGCCGGCSG